MISYKDLRSHFDFLQRNIWISYKVHISISYKDISLPDFSKNQQEIRISHHDEDFGRGDPVVVVGWSALGLSYQEKVTFCDEIFSKWDRTSLFPDPPPWFRQEGK